MVFKQLFNITPPNGLTTFKLTFNTNSLKYQQILAPNIRWGRGGVYCVGMSFHPALSYSPRILTILNPFKLTDKKMKPLISALELKVPPLLLLLGYFLIAYLATWLLPHAHFEISSNQWLHIGVCVIIAMLGLGFILAGVWSFKLHQTTVNPLQPETNSSLVQNGIYQFTRNPMYLGFLLLLLAWIIYLAHSVTLLLIPLFILYLNRFQIEPEERFLKAKFQQEFVSYCQAVRRWI